MFRECVSLVRQGVVRVDELDDIVTHSVGLRWAVAGPFSSFYLGGGPRGMQGFLEQFGQGMESRWESMMAPVSFDEQTTALLLDQTESAFCRMERAEMEAARDADQIAILNALARRGADWGPYDAL